MLYVTPHRWTPYFRLAADRRVIQTDRRRWDYKHQVLATRHMPPWRVLLWFKFIEMVRAVPAEGALPRAVPPRPRPAPRHALVHADGPAGLAATRSWNFLFATAALKNGPTRGASSGARRRTHEEEVDGRRRRPERRTKTRQAA